MNLAIIGAGKQAKEIFSLIMNATKDCKYEKIVIVGLVEDKANNIISEDYFFSLPKNDFEILIAMGEPSMREKMSKKYGNMGYQFATYVHEFAVVGENTEILPGTILLPFVYVAQEVKIAANTLIHAGARIENNCSIGNNCFISSGAFVGAKTSIGNSTFVGPNSSIKDQVLVGNNVIIGMGSNVISNIDNDIVVVGNPAKKLRDNVTKRVFS